MNENSYQLSLALDEVATAVAQWTVSAHEERDDALLARYAGDRTAWVNDTRQRVHLLAQSIAVECPDAFAFATVWSAVAFAARGISREDIRVATECMRDVAGDLPGALAEAAKEPLEAAIAALGMDSDPPPSTLDPNDPLDRRVLEVLAAILENRRRDAASLVNAALDDGLEPSVVYTRILEPALREVGRMWYLGDLSIADEHMTTAATEVIMSTVRLRWKPAESNGKMVVATSVAGDLHALGIRMVGDFLEADGWDLLMLGANTPASAVVATLGNYKAELLAVSVNGVAQLRDLAELIAAVRKEHPGVRIMVGGHVFSALPDLWKQVGADGYARSGEDSVREARSLVGLPV